jgi:hypothetical protein
MASSSTSSRSLFAGAGAGASPSTSTVGPPAPLSLGDETTRAYWVRELTRMAGPVLRALAERRLKRDMPVEGVGDDRYGSGGRAQFSHLEAIARTLVGIAPWLECGGGRANFAAPAGSPAAPSSSPSSSSSISSSFAPCLPPEEEALRAEFADLARRAIDSATDPASPDHVNFSVSFQPIVDAAFLGHAIVRAPTELWAKLPEWVKRNTVAAFKATRSRRPHHNNWLLFGGMIEAALCVMGEEDDWDVMRVDHGIRHFLAPTSSWYKGDGMYGDGPDYHADYYGSLVIHPMLLDILRVVTASPRGKVYEDWAAYLPVAQKRAVRYGEILERTIAPDGTYPPLGRSLAYRCGVMQHLAQMALEASLGKGVSPAQVRCALTAVMSRSLSPVGTYDDKGWLRVGFAGAQLEVGEIYISTGSLYLASAIFLPLGLPPSEPFWSDPPEMWTSARMWSGGFAPCDHALDHAVL